MYLGVIRSKPTAYSKVTIQHNHLNRKNIIMMIIIIIIIFINCKWVDTHPVAVVILQITYARTVKVDYTRFRWRGLHGKHVVATWKGKREPSQHLL
jgi:hypothetical protein